MAAVPAYAETPPSRAALLGIARGFVDKVGGGFERADRYLATIMPDDARADESFASIPDGEILLLRLSLGPRFTLADTVLGIKQGRDVMLSLRDFTAVSRFAITVDAAAGKAEGWYIREAQKFSFDTATGAVMAGDRRYTAGPEDFIIQDEDIFVRTQALGEWLDFNVKIVVSEQIAKIDSTEKWPVQAQMERRERVMTDRDSPPQLPRAFGDYTAASIPNIDLSVRQNYRRTGEDGKSTAATTYTAVGAGDLAGHTLRTAITGNDQDKLSSVRANFSKVSENPDLLGPLGARKYEFADISPTRVPWSGETRGGMGVRATSGVEGVTTNASTIIDGDSTPGWDVDLLRNGAIIATMTAGPDGRYSFDDVPLYAGENLFSVMQYGPLGEIREEPRRIVSSAALAGGDRSIYDISVSANNTQTWTKYDQDGPDHGTLDVAGLYEVQVTPEMTASAGARSTTVEGERKNFAHAGITQGIGGVLINANAGYDLDGAVAGDMGVRGHIMGQAVGMAASYTGPDYAQAPGETSPGQYTITSNAGGVLYNGQNFRAYYDGQSDYRFVDDGSKTFESRLNLSAAYRGVNLGQSFSDLREQDALGNDTKKLDGSTYMYTGLFDTRVRAGVNYQIKPDFEIDSYVLDLNRRISRDLRGNVRFTHNPEESYSEAQATLNWNAGPVALSPSVTYDSDNNLGAFLSLNSSLSYDPATGKAAMSGRSLSTVGGFSAFVYLDKDGDMKFTEGVDEPVKDASLRAVHSRLTALTDEKGEAFIYSLPSGRATDIIVEESSLPDPFWVTAFDGVSVLPRPGYTGHAEFPLHMAGEIDGTVRLKRDGGTASPLRGVMLYLYNDEGRRVRETATASDGFYLFDRVPPGRYLLMLAEEDATRYKFIRNQPQEIVVGYDGTTLYGNDITVAGGVGDVPIGFDGGFAQYLAANPHIPAQELAAGTAVLNLGSYRSQLLMGVVWYKVRTRYAGILGRGRLLVPPSRSYAAPKTGFHELLVELPGVGMEDAFHRCRQLQARDLYCGVQIVPGTGLKAAAAQDASVQTR